MTITYVVTDELAAGAVPAIINTYALRLDKIDLNVQSIAILTVLPVTRVTEIASVNQDTHVAEAVNVLITTSVYKKDKIDLHVRYISIYNANNVTVVIMMASASLTRSVVVAVNAPNITSACRDIKLENLNLKTNLNRLKLLISVNV